VLIDPGFFRNTRGFNIGGGPDGAFGEGATDFDLTSRVGNVFFGFSIAPVVFFNTYTGSLRDGRWTEFSKSPYFFESCAFLVAGLL